MNLAIIALLFSGLCNFIFTVWFLTIQKQINQIIKQTNSALVELSKRIPTLEYAVYEGSN